MNQGKDVVGVGPNSQSCNLYPCNCYTIQKYTFHILKFVHLLLVLIEISLANEHTDGGVLKTAYLWKLLAPLELQKMPTKRHKNHFSLAAGTFRVAQ